MSISHAASMLPHTGSVSVPDSAQRSSPATRASKPHTTHPPVADFHRILNAETRIIADLRRLGRGLAANTAWWNVSVVIMEHFRPFFKHRDASDNFPLLFRTKPPSADRVQETMSNTDPAYSSMTRSADRLASRSAEQRLTLISGSPLRAGDEELPPCSGESCRKPLSNADEPWLPALAHGCFPISSRKARNSSSSYRNATIAS
jgi:hypothetical protein